MAYNVLIVDDNKEIREVVNVLLSNEGYIVNEADNGAEAITKCEAQDLIILDIMMPGMDGFKTCRRIRELTNVPILFLTAKTLDQDKEDGFNSGGDDYLIKPFSYSELLSRVNALIRRFYVYRGKSNIEESNIIERNDLKVDQNSNRVWVGDEEVNLTEIEYRFLQLLITNPKRVFSNKELYESIWDESYLYTANNTIMVHIRNLRKKLLVDPSNPKYIRTIWGKGYRFD